MGKLLRYFAFGVLGLGVLAAGVAMFAEPFFAELYIQLGIDTAKWVPPILDFFQQSWAHFVIVAMMGFGAGVWAHWFATKFDRRQLVSVKASRPDTRLRIKIDASGSKHFLQDYVQNIDTWQQTVVALTSDQAAGTILHVDTLSLTFETQVEYERPVIDARGSIGAYNFYPLGNNGAVFQFFGPIQADLIDIWFPPPGYYASQNKLNQDRYAAPLLPKGIAKQTQP